MGINGLLKTLESISQKKHLSEYKGMRVAVDGYCWLHKSIFLIKSEVLENPHSTKYLSYLNRRLDSMLQNHIHPVIIFDGDKLPMKKEEESDREKKRDETMRYAKELFDKGLEEQARQKMIEAMDINPQMAYNFIKELKKKNIEFFVAPYEADAQLAYLAKIGYVDVVMTEDSDLLALGCPKVLFKQDLETGYGIEINLEDLAKCKEYDFTLFSHDTFLNFCILSGCDYFKLRGIGHKTAYNYVKHTSSSRDVIMNIKRGNKSIPADFEENFEKAFLTFKFQVIYCPKEKRMRHFNEIDNTIYTFIHKYQDISFLGYIYDSQTANEIVFGKIDPISHKKFEDTKSDIINKMFGMVPDKKDEKIINNISKINKIIVENYNSLNSSNPANNISSSSNQNPVFNNTTINNYFSNGVHANSANISIVQISNAVQSVGKISKRGRPPKTRPNYHNYNNNFNSYSSYFGVNSSNNIEINSKLQSSNSRGSIHITNNSLHPYKHEEAIKNIHSGNMHNDENKNLNEADIDFINAYIYDENKEDEYESDGSEKKKKPDSIQMIAMNSQTQINSHNLKRKFPFSSSQSQSSNEGKEFSFNNQKKFKYMNDYQMSKTNKNILGNTSNNNYGQSTSPETAYSSNFISPDPIPQVPISIGKYLSCSDNKENSINDMEIQEEENLSQKSNDTNDQLDFTEIIATYENAKEAIKKNSGDTKKLQALKFNTEKDSHRIVVTYDQKSTKKKIIEDLSATIDLEEENPYFNKLPNLNVTNINKIDNSSNNTINQKDSHLFQFDEYSYHEKTNESLLKPDFLKFTNGITKSKNY